MKIKYPSPPGHFKPLSNTGRSLRHCAPAGDELVLKYEKEEQDEVWGGHSPGRSRSAVTQHFTAQKRTSPPCPSQPVNAYRLGVRLAVLLLVGFQQLLQHRDRGDTLSLPIPASLQRGDLRPPHGAPKSNHPPRTQEEFGVLGIQPE